MELVGDDCLVERMQTRGAGYPRPETGANCFRRMVSESELSPVKGYNDTGIRSGKHSLRLPCLLIYYLFYINVAIVLFLPILRSLIPNNKIPVSYWDGNMPERG
jgi:hypothetical protein